MFIKSLIFTISFVLVAASSADVGEIENLGKVLFFDENLSQPSGQSCSSCHLPEVGFTGSDSNANATGSVMPGALKGRSGSRKPPSVSYAAKAEHFQLTIVSGKVVATGGLFWDGRATGDKVTPSIFPSHWSVDDHLAMESFLGPAVDQALGPFVNPLEQNLRDAEALCKRIARSGYSDMWTRTWGPIDRCSPENSDLVHRRAAFSIAVYEGSAEVESFSSRYDMALKSAMPGREAAALPLDGLTEAENEGLMLFFSPLTGCASTCHAGSISSDGLDPRETFVSNSARYFNLGIPRNPDNPFYEMKGKYLADGSEINPDGYEYVDLGLGSVDFDADGTADLPSEIGKFKTPTVRNSGRKPDGRFIKSYGHNGYFKSLWEVVHFYNTRDTKKVCVDHNGDPDVFVRSQDAIERNCWPIPEVASENIVGCDKGVACKVNVGLGSSSEAYCGDSSNPRGIGNMCLTKQQEVSIVKFLESLSDKS